MGAQLDAGIQRIDVLLTHLHMDHIQGLGFFDPLYQPGLDVHVWGPASTTLDLRERLARYLSPPLFPVRLRELPCSLTLHDVPLGKFEIGEFEIVASLVCHPGPTVGYRITEDGQSIAFLPDHEPALGVREFPGPPEWTSGFGLAEGVDLLIHDAQYSDSEYLEHVGWGHSSISQAVQFGVATGVGQLVTFHHDPAHDDSTLDRLLKAAEAECKGHLQLVAGLEGAKYALPEGTG
jgi:ribonuclease BN (tRNA processing enzyme)